MVYLSSQRQRLQLGKESEQCATLKGQRDTEMKTLLLLGVWNIAHGFDVVWNSPWPTQCGSNFSVPSDAITRWGVRTNAQNSFNGQAVSTFYNSPGRMTVGAWPCFTKNGTSVNGGLPQLGNLSAHLEQVRIDVARRLPEDFAGLAVLDWEEWTPWIDPLDSAQNSSLYFNRSVELAGGDVAAAVAAWNASSLAFMEQTLLAAREVRPKGHWGFIGVVQCTFDTQTEACRPEFQRRNDALSSLWAAGSALYPELYATCPFDTSGGPADTKCSAAAKLPLKIAARMREARRVVHSLPAKIPIVAFTWYALDGDGCAGGSPTAVGHCPLMRDPSDLHVEFDTARAEGASGMIVWGSSGDVRRGTTDCRNVADYLEGTLGPALQTAAAL